MEYVHEIRIDEARRILESSSVAVDDVGFSVGYQDPTFFRRLFKRKTGLTPAAYRRKFAAIAPYTEQPGRGSPPAERSPRLRRRGCQLCPGSMHFVSGVGMPVAGHSPPSSPGI